MNLELFPPYQKHSEPSLEAAVTIKPAANRLRDKVFAYVFLQGKHGATDDEIQVALDMNPSTERPRRVELVELGLIMRAPMNRKTRTGRQASVWIASAP